MKVEVREGNEREGGRETYQSKSEDLCETSVGGLATKQVSELVQGELLAKSVGFGDGLFQVVKAVGNCNILHDVTGVENV